ncbi:hypothetical protein IVB36_07805 [Bradyrhizobium sp. 35]|nr:hypothetical protein [Bradyrhizobium sp. 35]
MRAAIRDLNLRRRTHVSMAAIPRQLNPLLRGWIKYYGRFTRAPLGQSFDSQSDNGGLDDAKVQTLYGSQGQDRPRSRTTISRTSRVVRTLEDRHARLVRLMGAQ